VELLKRFGEVKLFQVQGSAGCLQALINAKLIFELLPKITLEPKGKEKKNMVKSGALCSKWKKKIENQTNSKAYMNFFSWRLQAFDGGNIE